MDKSDVKEKLGSLCRVMEAEAEAYRALLPLLSVQRQAAVNARLRPFVEAVGENEEQLKHLRRLESERLSVLETISSALQAPPERLTVSKLIALLPGEEAEKLNACRYRLQAVIDQVREHNKTNQDLLRHLLELMKNTVHVLAGRSPGERTYRENGLVRETERAADAVPGHISFEV